MENFYYLLSVIKVYFYKKVKMKNDSKKSILLWNDFHWYCRIIILSKQRKQGDKETQEIENNHFIIFSEMIYKGIGRAII